MPGTIQLNYTPQTILVIAHSKLQNIEKYRETCLKRDLCIMETCFNETILQFGLCSDDQNFKCLYLTEPYRNGGKNSARFRYRQLSQY
jgi:hypothetical protein